MSKPKKEPIIESSEIPKNQHLALNNLSMIAFWIKKKKLTDDQITSVLNWTKEALNEIKKV